VLLEHSSHTPVLEETERYLEVVRVFLHEAESQAARRPGSRAARDEHQSSKAAQAWR
jgi:hypothetical protein